MIGKYKTYEKYEQALRNRRKNLMDIMNRILAGKDKLPISYPCMGFRKLELKSMNDLISRISEISDILHEPVPVIVFENKEDNLKWQKEVN